MEKWKCNSRRGSYWKKEVATLKMSKNTEAYEDFDENSPVVRVLPKNSKVIYREIILINNHVWVECSGTNETFYIPLRRWNGVPPDSRKYEVGPLKHRIIEIEKRGKHMDKETRNGIDIYIDREKEIMYVSINEKMALEAYEKIIESFRELTGYQIVVFESINDIKFLN